MGSGFWERRRLVADLIAECGSDCHYCGRGLSLAAGTLTVEHIWPRAWGGGNYRWNLTVACALCNSLCGSDLGKCWCPRCTTALWRSLSVLGYTSGRTRPLRGRTVRDLVDALTAAPTG